MNLDADTTTPRPDGSGEPRGIRIGHLDRTDPAPQSEPNPGDRILWVSLRPPRSLLGWLFDERSFEGAWLERNGQAQIRLWGQPERGIPTPLFHSPEAARTWLTSELLKSAADPGCPDTAPENLAA